MKFVARCLSLPLPLAVGLAAAAPAPVASTPAPPPLPADLRRDRAVEVVERVLPSVVNISTRTLIEVRDPFEALLREMWGLRPRTEEGMSIGSGVIIDEEGHLLTNDHVVRRATEIWVKLADGRERQADRVITSQRSDVALLKIRALPSDRFTPIALAADDDLYLGETVLALGNPFGLGGSVSRGILSSKNRRPPAEAQQMGVGDWLQTDAAINPGSSGGPLVNLNGELIGLNVAVYREGQGIGFAIPIRAVMDSLAEIFTPERTRGLWFGAAVREVRDTSETGLAPAGPARRGILTVTEVQAGSPAATAGLRPGDGIVAVNGRAPRSFIEFTRWVADAGAGQNVSLTVRRGDAERAVTVRLIEEKEFFNAALIRRRLGLTLETIPASLARRLPATWAGGFQISAVESNGPAAEAGLQRGMIVTAIEGQAPGDLVEAAKLIHAIPAGGEVQLEVRLLRQRGSSLIPQVATATLQTR
jgi:S1-C subfamily serine protease